jgi:hypothetical protein
MSISSRIQQAFSTQRRNDDAEGSESDVPVDPALASSRATGGEHVGMTGDQGSVTGTGVPGVFVGRVAGDDLGYAGETGAERRAEAGEGNSGSGTRETGIPETDAHETDAHD